MTFQAMLQHKEGQKVETLSHIVATLFNNVATKISRWQEKFVTTFLNSVATNEERNQQRHVEAMSRHKCHDITRCRRKKFYCNISEICRDNRLAEHEGKSC